MIRTWYIIYKNFGGKYLALIDAINEAEALKILQQSAVIMDTERIEDMHTVLHTKTKELMIASFNASKKPTF